MQIFVKWANAKLSTREKILILGIAALLFPMLIPSRHDVLEWRSSFS
jgi:hypothetical protein